MARLLIVTYVRLQLGCFDVCLVLFVTKQLGHIVEFLRKVAHFIEENFQLVKLFVGDPGVHHAEFIADINQLLIEDTTTIDKSLILGGTQLDCHIVIFFQHAVVLADESCIGHLILRPCLSDHSI